MKQKKPLRTFLAVALLGSAAPAAADFVILDDLIVDGRACVGYDCVNGESFDFEEIKLKQHNLRLKFQDSSVAASFPTVDWQITINDTANGGLSRFSIDDLSAGRTPMTIRANAPSHSFYVRNNGNIGFGTSTPVLDVHLKDNDTPTFRLEQDGSSGWSPQTWDVAGNESNFFVRDVTNSSQLPFRIRPGAPTDSIHIAAGGNVGIGTGSIDDKFQISGESAVARFENTLDSREWRIGSAGSERFFISDATGSTFPVIIEETAPTDALRMASSGNIGLGTNNPQARLHTVGTVRFAGLPSCASGIVSDASGNLSCLVSTRSLKHIGGILSPDVALRNVMALKPMTGAYKATPDQPEHWLIAEEVADVDPALVGLNKGEPYTVKLQGLVTDLIAVTQEQQRVIEDQARRLAALEQKLTER